jgi:tetratricopeptide (TPR) repeat protein
VQWNTVLLYTRGLVGLTREQEEAVRQLKLAVELNLAAAHHKQGRSDRALQHARNAVELDPQNPKALFRRGRALLLKGDIDAAGDDLSAAMRLEPKSAEIRAEHQLYLTKHAEHERKAKRTFAAVFRAMKAEDDAATTTTTTTTTTTSPAPQPVSATASP